MRLLLVEDHADLAEWVAKTLRHAGYVLDVLERGDHADAALRTQTYDLVILDLSLPGMDGLEVLRRLRAREQGPPTPVLVLTARGATEERVRGLNLGADDYLAKPFDLAELEARIKALLRRSGNLAPTVRIGRLEFDTTSRLASVGGRPLALTPRAVASSCQPSWRLAPSATSSTFDMSCGSLASRLSPICVIIGSHFASVCGEMS